MTIDTLVESSARRNASLNPRQLIKKCLMSYDEETYDDDLDDDESVDSDDDEMDCLPCPNCKVMIAEDSQRCPACGEYVTFSGGLTHKGLWWWIAWSLLAILAIFWLFNF